ncbi:hypothetical protein RF11_02314 [Thelohanellus kitauei]|uniref:DUF4377 domain-containing protein n=1 Tax=Thelohanellus kitauei TaxID=669202 RepID=A0A0C2N0X1_THEKT|nr:hypothetical protein RF11_02314 [Thelohanellus kitauei]
MMKLIISIIFLYGTSCFNNPENEYHIVDTDYTWYFTMVKTLSTPSDFEIVDDLSLEDLFSNGKPIKYKESKDGNDITYKVRIDEYDATFFVTIQKMVDGNGYKLLKVSNTE